MNALIKEKGGTFSLNKSEPIHRWYPYVEGYSSCLIAEELKKFLVLKPNIETIYDPFCGTGTTSLVASTYGIESFYSESNPFMQTVIETKVNVVRMPTVPDEKNAGIADGVVINNSWAPKAILGEGGKVTGIELMRCVSVRDASGKFAPVYDENETITVPCSNVLVAIGQRSVYGDVLAGTAAETADGRLIAHDAVTFQSNEPDIFVGGDCATGPKYTIDAIATGREGAVSIHRFVNKGQTLTIHRNTREFKELNKDDIVLPTEKIKKPARAAVAIDSKKVRTMQDDRVTFTEEQIRSEASRCLSCGRSVVDPNKCIGCGICTTKCEFDAIHLKRVRPQNSKMIPAEDKFKAIGPYAAKRQVKIIKKSLAEKKK